MRWLPLLLLLAGCQLLPVPGAPTPTPYEPPVLDLGPPTAVKADLRLKRWRQVSLDLEGALELPGDSICNELGLFPCTTLNAAAIGGISIDNGLFRPIDDTIPVTAGPAIERMVLYACTERRALDEAGDPAVFTVSSGESLTAGEGEAQIATLYQRMLARDPLPEEVAATLGLHAGIVADGGDNHDWAWMVCFALGTTTEALLF